MSKDKEHTGRTVAQNRRAYRDYFIDETFEAGIVLQGTEVKSMRQGRGTIQEAYAGEMKGELYLFNLYIPEYSGGNRFNHETRRPRKLLMHRREISHLFGAVQRKGQTLIPLSLYFNARGIAKVRLGLARGKKLYDKRHSERDRDWKRDKARIMRGRGKVSD